MVTLDLEVWVRRQSYPASSGVVIRRARTLNCHLRATHSDLGLNTAGTGGTSEELGAGAESTGTDPSPAGIIVVDALAVERGRQPLPRPLPQRWPPRQPRNIRYCRTIPRTRMRNLRCSSQ